MEDMVDSVVDSTPVEKTLTQSQVNELIGREKARAAQSARAEAEREYQRKLEEELATARAQAQRNAEVPRDVDANAIYQQVRERLNEEAQREAMERQMAQIADSYVTKVQDAKARIPDFDAVMADFDPTSFPQLVYLVAGMDNGGDIMYELSKNPQKLITMDALAQRSPRQAQSELLKLSRSIAENQQALLAAESENTNAPLDRLQPSRANTGGGEKSVSDFRSMSWLRG